MSTLVLSDATSSLARHAAMLTTLYRPVPYLQLLENKIR